MNALDLLQHETTYDELEALFVNNSSMQRIEAYLNRFNPIRVMKMEGMEIRHSAILAWLLNPKETHGLGDHFLKAFLAEALKGNSRKRPNALQVSQSDMRDADVRCEWNNIDIFVLSPQNRWAFIIENKVYSKQHAGQLAKYRSRVMELFRAQDTSNESETTVDICGIFLTLREEGPEDDEYTSTRYEKICGFLQIYLEQEAYLFTPEVATFLTHYLRVLEELTGMSKERSEMENLARKLYRDHKKVLDFIIEHGSGSDFSLAVHRLFGDNPGRGDVVRIGEREFVYCGLAKSLVSFLPALWRDELDKTGGKWDGCENWWAGYPFIVWAELRAGDDGVKGHLKLNAEVGPISNHEIRKSIIDAIKSEASANGLSRIQFQSGATDIGRVYSRFLKKNSVTVNDIYDTDELEKKLKQLLAEFEPEFDLITKVIPQFSQFDGFLNSD